MDQPVFNAYWKLSLIITTLFLMVGCETIPWIESINQDVDQTSNINENKKQQEQLVAQLEQAKSEQSELNIQLKELQSANLLLKEELNNQKNYNSTLNMAYLVKHAEVNRLILDQQATIQEMVRIQSKLLSRNSRAETVSTLAEATMMVSKAEEISLGDQQAIVQRARQLLLMSNDALQEGNFDGATFLANQSSVMVQALITLNDQIDADVESTRFEGRFAIPIDMKSLANANIRTDADVKSEVRFTIDKDQKLQANGYFSNWIHVTVGDRQGWIYYKLIDLDLE